MNAHARTIKIWGALFASMTIGALVLLATETKRPSNGAFSLASYTSLNPVNDAVAAVDGIKNFQWANVQIYYSNSVEGNVEFVAKSAGSTSKDDANMHFLICNGQGGKDGQIQTTRRWQKQIPCLADRDWRGDIQTIRVCVISDGIESQPTDCQIKRVDTLVSAICAKYKISASRIKYPAGWEL